MNNNQQNPNSSEANPQIVAPASEPLDEATQGDDRDASSGVATESGGDNGNNDEKKFKGDAPQNRHPSMRY